MSSPIPEAMQKTRRAVSARFLAGRGVEIGALHSPLWVGERAKVTYVDRLRVDELRQHYAELDSLTLTPVDVIDDGERLATFADESLDFIIANHMLEHCENPLGSLRNHLSKLKMGGCLYYAVPDKRFTFDSERALTSFDHLVRDDREGPEWSREEHFLDWARLVDKHTDEAAALERARRLMAMSYSIHFHVWDYARFRDILEAAHAYLGRGFRIDWLEQNHGEVIAVLRKCRPLAPHKNPFTPLRMPLRGRLSAFLRQVLKRS